MNYKQMIEIEQIELAKKYLTSSCVIFTSMFCGEDSKTEDNDVYYNFFKELTDTGLLDCLSNALDKPNIK